MAGFTSSKRALDRDDDIAMIIANLEYNRVIVPACRQRQCVALAYH